MPNQRVLVNRPASLRIALTDAEGLHTSPTGTLTATCTRLDESTVTLGAAAVDAFGNVTVPVSADQLPVPDVLTLTVSDNGNGALYTTEIDVAGAHYFTITEVRDIEKSVRNDTVKYGDADIARARLETEEECERICRQAFVPRAGRVIVAGDGSNLLFGDFVPTRLRSVKIGGVALTSDELAAVMIEDGGTLRRANAIWPAGSANVEVIYEHGMPAPPPDLKRAALKRLRERLNMAMGGVPDRATSVTSDGSTFSIATPGRGGFETGSPEVDAVYFRYRNDRLVVA